MPDRVTETFFLPEEVGRRQSTIPAEIYNLALTLLKRSEYNCVFVPIRSLQFLGVVTGEEIVFVDSQAYAYNQDEGGRLIMLAWEFVRAAERQSLNDPVDCNVLFYHTDSHSLQSRLVSEFHQAMQLLDQRYRDRTLPPSGAKILKLQNTDTRN